MFPKIIGPIIILLVVLTGCASYENPAPTPLQFEPIKKTRFKTENERKVAHEIAKAKCRAYGMQVAAGAPVPAMPQRHNVNVNIQTVPVYASHPPSLPQPYIPDSSSMIAAAQAGDAVRFRNELFLSSAVACMAEEGWILKQ